MASFADDLSTVGEISKEITLSTREIVSGISLIKDSMDGIRHSATELQDESRTLNKILSEQNQELK